MFNRSILLLGVLFSFVASANPNTLSFWKKREPYLKFLTAPQSVFVSNCSGIVTVQALKPWGSATPVSSPLTVNLTGTGLTYYSDSNCATPITSLTIPISAASASFYFVPSTTGSVVLTASATSYKDVSQTETLSTNPFVWTGGGANSNWNTGLNWSGGVAPGSANQVVFNSVCVTNCSPNLTANVTVAGIRIYSGYSGTITQNTFTFSVNSSIGWYQEAGTFAGGSNTFTMLGPYTLNGGSFTGSSTANNFTANIGVVSGTFSPGAGTVTITGSGTLNTGSAIFQNVNMYPANGNTYTVTGTFYVNGNLTLSNTTGNTRLNGGVVDVKGNVIVLNEGLPGSATIKLTGAGTQSIDASTASGTRNLPGLEIASTGPVNFLGNLKLQGSYLYTSSGTFDAGTSSLMFLPVTATSVNMGPVTYYDVGYSSNYNLSVLTDVIVSHKFILSATNSNAGYIEGPGKILLKGDLEINDQGGGKSVDIVISLSGNTNQTVSYLSAGAKTPGFEINSTGGTVTFPSTFTFNERFKYIQGTVAGLTTSNFVGHDGSVETIESGSYVFNDVFFTNGFNGAAYTIIGSMNVGGNLNFGNDSYNSVTGTVNLYGNLTYTGFYSYNVKLNLMGSGNQTLSAISENNSGVTFNVNKTGGTARLLGAVNCGNASFTLTSGNFDMNGFGLTIKSIPGLNGNTLTKNGGVLRVNGSTIGTGALYGGTVAP